MPIHQISPPRFPKTPASEKLIENAPPQERSLITFMMISIRSEGISPKNASVKWTFSSRINFPLTEMSFNISLFSAIIAFSVFSKLIAKNILIFHLNFYYLLFLPLINDDIINHINPAENTVDYCPQYGMPAGIGNHHGQARPKGNPCFNCFLYCNILVCYHLH